MKRSVGYLPGELSVDPAITGAQILQYLGNLSGGVDQRYVKMVSEVKADGRTIFLSSHILPE
ncbi:MAG: hypothetical protein Q8R28_05255, partial [Dehalococcoidia bacterium]|nr:hypothetical protein [Dehalococcoidia bacterium]